MILPDLAPIAASSQALVDRAEHEVNDLLRGAVVASTQAASAMAISKLRRLALSARTGSSRDVPTQAS